MVASSTGPTAPPATRRSTRPGPASPFPGLVVAGQMNHKKAGALPGPALAYYSFVFVLPRRTGGPAEQAEAGGSARWAEEESAPAAGWGVVVRLGRQSAGVGGPAARLGCGSPGPAG